MESIKEPSELIKRMKDDINVETTIPSSNLGLTEIFKLQEEINSYSKKKIIFGDPLLTINDNPLIFPNTINVIQGKYGAHKSRLTEHFASTLLMKSNCKSILGLKRNSNESIKLVYIDTEREVKKQYPCAIQSIRTLAGYNYDEEIPNAVFHSFLMEPREIRLSKLKDVLNDLKFKSEDHLVVALDVLSDFIQNFNNPKETLLLTDFMNKLINNYDVTFICVIHENPVGEAKARGHLGTELVNKASTVLSINYNKDDSQILKVKNIKCRNTRRYEPLYCKFDKDMNQLVYATADELEIANSNNKAPVTEVVQYLIDNLTADPIERKELLRKLSGHFDCAQRTLEDRLSIIESNSLLSKTGYKLVKENAKKFNRKTYRLERLPMDFLKENNETI